MGMPDPLLGIVIQANGDVLPVNGQSLQVHDHRMGKTGDLHRPAGIGHHRKLRNLLLITRCFDSQGTFKVNRLWKVILLHRRPLRLGGWFLLKGPVGS